jgi:hypothetical protein
VFVGVWVDQIVYWVVSNNEVKASRNLSHQHRGGIEYQIGITHSNIAEFDAFRIEATLLAETVIRKGRLAA